MRDSELECPVAVDPAQETEGAEWTDAEIDAGVAAADPMVLRGLLYYLTGDEDVAATTAGKTGAGAALSGFVVLDPDEVKLLRERATGFLKRHRELGVSAV